jgi:sucrose-6-phosphate hydrolase SacC (GH32 family)
VVLVNISHSKHCATLINRLRVGEDKTNGTSFININCYSSTNLVEWNYEGALLTRTASGDTGPGRVIERPKVMFNKKTNKYVLWMHIDSSNYGEAKIGVATGDSVCGKYTYIRSERPLGFESRDSGVYVDDDGKGYLLTEDVCQTLEAHTKQSNSHSAKMVSASISFPTTT